MSMHAWFSDFGFRFSVFGCRKGCTDHRSPITDQRSACLCNAGGASTPRSAIMPGAASRHGGRSHFPKFPACSVSNISLPLTTTAKSQEIPQPPFPKGDGGDPQPSRHVAGRRKRRQGWSACAGAAWSPLSVGWLCQSRQRRERCKRDFGYDEGNRFEQF